MAVRPGEAVGPAVVVEVREQDEIRRRRKPRGLDEPALALQEEVLLVQDDVEPVIGVEKDEDGASALPPRRPRSRNRVPVEAGPEPSIRR
jgi:hypothetical protein